ncbi:MAG: RNA polymerase sigma factor [Acidobacteriota bacterium]|nr:RNA polymerase sigma factor [Acidobacteriota bacterium]
MEPLVARARASDRRALEELLAASYDLVYPVCLRILGNPFDAADAAQEALMSVVRGLPRFDGRSRYATWLYRIAMNAAIDEFRRRSRRPLSSDPLDEPGPRGRGPGGADSGVTGGADEGLGMMDLEAALMDIPLDFRAAVVLRDVCGLDYAEIARVLSLPGGTVRSRIARGRALLAERLGSGMESGR